MVSFPTRPLLILVALGIATLALLASLRAPTTEPLSPTATMIQKSRVESPPTPGSISTSRHTPTPRQTTTPTNRIVIEPPSESPRPVNTSTLTAFDFLRDYLTNRSYPSMIEGMPWTNNTVNVAQLQEHLGGVTYWDFFSEPENWDSPFYMWQDDHGNWRPYAKQTIRDAAGREVIAYELLDRAGPGAMDRLWFTQDAVWMLTTEQSRKDVGPIKKPEDLSEWGNLIALGNLRIEVDERVAYDGSVIDWISGNALHLTPELTRALTWRHREFGSSGNLIPILYQKHLRVLTYGGTKKPKWFLATGVRFSDTTPVKPFTGAADFPVAPMAPLARNVLQPENFIDTLGNVQTFNATAQPGNPALIELTGSGTLDALQFRIAKRDDPKQLALRIKYNNITAIDLPLIAFFGDQKFLTPHRSTPLGIIETNDAYLFYCNYPLPYRDGMTIELVTANRAIPISARLVISGATANAQLVVDYRPPEKLAMHSPDYQVKLRGDGKLVGIVLQTEDQKLDAIPKILVPGKPGVEDPVKRAWAMGYLEGNLTLTDGLGRTRIFGGHEDWADGGFYFNRGYTEPAGGSNRPFGGILRYKDGKDGYATIYRYFNDLSAFRFKNGLTLAFGHGTWQNNFPVSYGTTVYYYRDIAP